MISSRSSVPYLSMRSSSGSASSSSFLHLPSPTISLNSAQLTSILPNLETSLDSRSALRDSTMAFVAE